MLHDTTPLDTRPDPGRRDVMQAAGAALVAVAASASAVPTSALAQSGTAGAPAGSSSRNGGPLGARLRGVQHFGITVQNMDRAFEFYTEVLGGQEIMRDGDFQGDRIQNTLLLTEEIDARARGINPGTVGIPDMRGGAQRLDVRFIQFDNVVIELLQYRDATQPQGTGNSFAPANEFTSPAYPRSMHVCFYLRDDVDFNQFVRDLEAESARRGMTNVRANRIVTAATEQQRLQASLASNSNAITEGPSAGWSLIYCKGPEGEQLEFVQVLGPAKLVFDGAIERRAKALR